MKKILLLFVVLALALSASTASLVYYPHILCVNGWGITPETDFAWTTQDGFMQPVDEFCQFTMRGVGKTQYHLVAWPRLESEPSPDWFYPVSIAALSFNPKSRMDEWGFPQNSDIGCKNLIVRTGDIGKDVTWGYMVELWNDDYTFAKYWYQDKPLPNHTYRYSLTQHTFSHAYITNMAFDQTRPSLDGLTNESVSIGFKFVRCTK
jgi:hypothetical protein